LCPIHDDAAASDIILKVDPATVPFNTSLSTVGGLFLMHRSSSIARLFRFALKASCWFVNPKPIFFRFFDQLHCHQRNRDRPGGCEGLHSA
jgi:hypothetical protein